MIETYNFLDPDFQRDSPRELTLLSLISQSFFQPFSADDNLLVILTALTSGSGVGFNRAMLLLKEGDELKGTMWLGPSSPEEARSIWDVLSTPNIGYVEIIEHNRTLIQNKEDSLTRRVRKLTFRPEEGDCPVPAHVVCRKEIILVRDAAMEPRVDPRFREALGLGVDEFLCVPLLARDEVLGVVVLDNAFTHAPIQPRDVKLAALCGLMAGNYLYSSRMHERLVASEKMAAMGEVAVFITHQIRNPLVTIGGFTEQLLRPDLDAGKRRRNLEIIRDEVKRLEDIVFQVGHFLKINLKDPIYVDVHATLEAALRGAEEGARARGVILHAKVEKCLPKVYCDPASLGEVVRNLLDNAFEATPAGGTVSIRAYRPRPLWFALSVRDTGQGIAPADRSRLFKPFFTTKAKGMGLGLPFIKSVVDRCGGRIDVRSREGRGTQFLLSFPCRDEKETP
jgi:signal transduction histidine kinase